MKRSTRKGEREGTTANILITLNINFSLNWVGTLFNQCRVWKSILQWRTDKFLRALMTWFEFVFTGSLIEIMLGNNYGALKSWVTIIIFYFQCRAYEMRRHAYRHDLHPTPSNDTFFHRLENYSRKLKFFCLLICELRSSVMKYFASCETHSPAELNEHRVFWVIKLFSSP